MDGKVLSKSKSKIRIEYKDGNKETLKLGNKSTKIENGVSYKQGLVSDFKKEDRFDKNDILVYNASFFEKDFFDNTKLVYVVGTTLRVAMIEDTVTDEDSCAISKSISKKLSTDTYKVKSFIVSSDQEVVNILDIGTEVNQNSILFTIKDKDILSNTLDKETIELLSSIKSKSPKAKISGTIDKIVVYYNSELDDLSLSLKKLAESSDKIEGIPGKVTNEYSIQGKPLITGNVEIKVFISAEIPAGLGDKGVFGNQLKTTIGEVYQNRITSEDGSEIEALFGQRSAMARIVESPLIIGTTTSLLKEIAKKAIEIHKP